jgi:glycosyltransferase involved in cell wall biosynthesis
VLRVTCCVLRNTQHVTRNTHWDATRIMVQVTFVMEQHIGHRSFYENLRRCVERLPEIDPHWVKVTYYNPDSIWNRLPLPANIRGTLTGRRQVQQGLLAKTYDVAYFNTQVPAALTSDMLQQPYVISTDITPRQYDRMGEHYGHRPDGPGWLGRYKHQVNVNLLRRAGRVLPWSTWTRDSLIHDYGVKPDKIEVLPPGVDIERWCPGQSPTSKPLRILFVGGEMERKGGELLLEAFHTLPPGSAELILVTRSAVPTGERVIAYQDLTPNSLELIALYRSCDVFVLPTDAEAFGIAAVEASAVGLPVIATAVGGLTDIVVDGQTGFLIQPGNRASLISRLHLLAGDANFRQRLGHAGRQRVEERFDAGKNAKRLAQILEGVCQGK